MPVCLRHQEPDLARAAASRLQAWSRRANRGSGIVTAAAVVVAVTGFLLILNTILDSTPNATTGSQCASAASGAAWGASGEQASADTGLPRATSSD
jgi:hypothetical protein